MCEKDLQRTSISSRRSPRSLVTTSFHSRVKKREYGGPQGGAGEEEGEAAADPGGEGAAQAGEGGTGRAGLRPQDGLGRGRLRAGAPRHQRAAQGARRHARQRRPQPAARRREGAEGGGGGGRHGRGRGGRRRAALALGGGGRQPGEEAGGPGQPGHHGRAPDEHPAPPERDVLEADADLRERQRLDAVEEGHRQELLHDDLLR